MTYIDNGLPWWQVLLLTAAGGVIALLARDGWEWLVDRWNRPPRGTHDTTADNPERPDYDKRWRDGGHIPPVPDQPTEVVAKWWHTRHGLHLYGYRYATGGEPLPYTYTAENAALEAEERGLRPCRACNPLAPSLLDAEPVEVAG